MVRYYFQLINGEFKFVLKGTKEELQKLVDADLLGDKEKAKENVDKELKKVKEELKIAEDKRAKATEPKEVAELDYQIARFKYMIFSASQEVERIDTIDKKDLMFFELTAIEI